jgi:hypothetical protein
MLIFGLSISANKTKTDTVWGKKSGNPGSYVLEYFSHPNDNPVRMMWMDSMFVKTFKYRIDTTTTYLTIENNRPIVKVDTSKTYLVIPTNIEMIVPVHWWEEEYYGHKKAVVDHTVLILKEAWDIQTIITYPFIAGRDVTHKYYSIDWKKELKGVPITLYYIRTKIDTVRYKE